MDRLAPERFWLGLQGGAAKLAGGESFTEGVELEGGRQNATASEQACRGEWRDARVQRRERGGRCRAKARPHVRVGSPEADREEGRVIEREPTEHERRVDQVAAR